MSKKVLELNVNDFDQEVMSSDRLVVVDFWAQWCGPCKILSPIMDNLSETFENKVKIAKVNVDEQPELTTRFKIMSLPTILFFKDGEIIEKIVGMRNEADLQKTIEKHL